MTKYQKDKISAGQNIRQSKKKPEKKYRRAKQTVTTNKRQKYVTKYTRQNIFLLIFFRGETKNAFSKILEKESIVFWIMVNEHGNKRSSNVFFYFKLERFVVLKEKLFFIDTIPSDIISLFFCFSDILSRDTLSRIGLSFGLIWLLDISSQIFFRGCSAYTINCWF